jgi:hypothetical protein
MNMYIYVTNPPNMSGYNCFGVLSHCINQMYLGQLVVCKNMQYDDSEVISSRYHMTSKVIAQLHAIAFEQLHVHMESSRSVISWNYST